MSDVVQLEHPIPIHWCVPDDVVARYATNMIVQHTGPEFVISFFEMLPPLMLGSPDEVRQKLMEFDHVDAQCVGRIIVAAERMPAFIEALQQNLQRANERQEE